MQPDTLRDQLQRVKECGGLWNIMEIEVNNPNSVRRIASGSSGVV